MEYLQIVALLVFCVGSESTIRMQRDFSYPIVEEFDVYWNVPSFLCHKYGINFENYTKYYGIITNPDDHFRGRHISILYDPGLFPAMMKNAKGRMFERNGGIPQLGNLTAHLESFKEIIEKVVPEDFDGVGVIDFEAWRPIFRQNWNEQLIYKAMSRELVRQYHPQWTEQKIELYASYHFEEASKAFMENTLRLAKLVRPNGVWGYYAFPYCFNYRQNKEPNCAEIVEKENNKIHWMFDESTAIYPSIYMNQELAEEEQRKFVIGRLNEAWRVASRVSNKRVPLVYPYIWYKYVGSKGFLSEGDMYTALETTRKYKMGGAIIWGATENVSSKEKCQEVLDYLIEVLGPTVVRVKNNKSKVDEAESHLGFVPLPLPFIPHVESPLISTINQTLHPKNRQERSTTTLSPQLQNYYAWVEERRSRMSKLKEPQKDELTTVMTSSRIR